DLRKAGQPSADILCDEVMTSDDLLVSPRAATAEEAVGEAQEPLTPLGFGCAAAVATLALEQNKFCGEHPSYELRGQVRAWHGGPRDLLRALLMMRPNWPTYEQGRSLPTLVVALVLCVPLLAHAALSAEALSLGPTLAAAWAGLCLGLYVCI